MKLIEGKRDPARLAVEKRAAVVHARKQSHVGKAVSKLTPAAQGELLEVIAIALGIADESGVVI